MREKPVTLKDYWSVVEHPAISLEEIRAIVDSRDEPAAPKRMTSTFAGRRVAVVGIAALIGGAVIAGRFCFDDAMAPTAAPRSGAAPQSAASQSAVSQSEAASRPATSSRLPATSDGLPATSRGPRGPESREPASSAAAVTVEPAGSGMSSSTRRSRTSKVQSMATEATRADGTAHAPASASVEAPNSAAHPLREEGVAIDLSRDELARIGVQTTDSGVVQYFWQYLTRPRAISSSLGVDSLGDSPEEVWSTDARIGQVLRGDIRSDTVETFIRMDVDASARVEYPTFSPELVTTASGRFLPMYYRFDLMMSGVGSMSHRDMASISDRLNADPMKRLADSSSIQRMIPIRVQNGEREVILWYAAHTRFLAVLPRRVQVRLRHELAARRPPSATDRHSQRTRRWLSSTVHDLDSLLSATRTHDGESDRETGSCYFAACGTASGALEMIGVEPNAVEVDAQVRIGVAVARTLTIALHSFDGRLLRILAAGIAAESGQLHHRVRFDGVEAGMYLVVVTSDAGERVSSRVLVR